jgi:hypothetical protein
LELKIKEIAQPNVFFTILAQYKLAGERHSNKIQAILKIPSKPRALPENIRQARNELATVKHSSLFWRSVSDEEKSLKAVGT